MTIWGLQLADVLVVAAYMLAMLYIGKRLAKHNTNQEDFYLAGRKLGKLVQFFLNFGNMTDANSAISVCSLVVRNGVAGVWLGFQMLLITPYYWFMAVWYRRVRLVTIAELFHDRFGGKFLGIWLSATALITAPLGLGLGYILSAKTMEAMMVKPASAYTVEDQRCVDDFGRYQELKQAYQEGDLGGELRQEYDRLRGLHDQGEIRSYISYLDRNVFYVIYGLIVGLYVVMGGFAAAAISDTIQGMLIIVFSLLLLPFGLAKVGGFEGMHAQVPAYMFEIFGRSGASEFTWHSIMCIVIASWLGVTASAGNMAVCGSAKDELAARVGAVTGGFFKRFMTMAWALCGLIALAYYGANAGDPDTSWGRLSFDLLAPGLTGLMLAGILAANMSTLDASSMILSGLFVRNLYMPLLPGKSEKHYVLVGRLAVIVLLGLGMIIAMHATGVIPLLKYMAGLHAGGGAPVLLLFFWRRLTKNAVILQVLVFWVFAFVLTWLIPLFPGVRTSSELAALNDPAPVTVVQAATEEDVAAGLADEVGQRFEKTHRPEPVSLYWDAVGHSDPTDPESPLRGQGPFKIQIYVLKLFGYDVEKLSASGLITARFTFNNIFPFVLLFTLSYVTKPTGKRIVDRFYVKLKTPVAATPEEDEAELARSYAQPDRFNHLKIFPRSNWEFCKWTRQDVVGFSLCWVAVVVILVLFWLVLHVGAAGAV